MEILHNRIEQAGALKLPTANEVIISKEELLNREKAGMYCFDGK
jgi:hypothetical protein